MVNLTSFEQFLHSYNVVLVYVTTQPTQVTVVCSQIGAVACT